jgi:hypothetical protein
VATALIKIVNIFDGEVTWDKVANATVTVIETLGVGAVEPPHPRHQATIRGFDEQFAIRLVEENVLAHVASGHLAYGQTASTRHSWVGVPLKVWQAFPSVMTS